MNKISFEEAKGEIEKELQEFNFKIVQIANSASEPIFLKVKSPHSPDFLGGINNPVDLFIKRVSVDFDGKFAYKNGSISS